MTLYKVITVVILNGVRTVISEHVSAADARSANIRVAERVRKDYPLAASKGTTTVHVHPTV